MGMAKITAVSFEVPAKSCMCGVRRCAGRLLDVTDAGSTRRIESRRTVILCEAVQQLWQRVRDRTIYHVDFDSEKSEADSVRASQTNSTSTGLRSVGSWGLEAKRSRIEESADLETETRYVDAVGVALPNAVGCCRSGPG